GISDAFVTKLNPAVPGPSALIYSSYYGGSSSGEGTGIALDTNANFYICGLSDSSDLPPTAGAYQTNFAGVYSDAFVAKYLSVPDMSVSIVASSNPVMVGSNLTYTLQVNNNAAKTTFNNVFLTNYLPAGVQFISVTSSRGSCANNAGTITCNLGT